MTGAGQAVNTIVSVDLAGRGEAAVIVSGNDFYSAPRLSPNGSQLAWLTWNHPNMPWDGNELWVAELTDEGAIRAPHRVAGGEQESIEQPEWSPDGVLHFMSDRIKRALDGELYFYSRVFGFDLADPVEPVPIENLETAAPATRG